MAGEIKNPQRNLPASLGLGVGAVIVLYMLANVAYLNVLSPDEIAATDRVAALAAERAFGSAGRDDCLAHDTDLYSGRAQRRHSSRSACLLRAGARRAVFSEVRRGLGGLRLPAWRSSCRAGGLRFCR